MPDMYSDASDTQAPPATESPMPEAAAPEAEPEATPEEGATAEIPRSVLGGKDFKPGEEVVLEVVQVNENSVVVKYASEKGDYAEEPPAAAPAGGGGGNPMYE